MNGAQSLFKALVEAGLDTCFANPGTSEMQLVYEMGLTGDMRPILCLQENTVTGAADGYARMAGKPAFTLLHVGSGFANGIANLHNAGRANTPIVNVVGANASYHQHNFPEHELINGKITDLARVVSHWSKEAKSASDLGVLGAMAARYARIGSGKICTVVAPTNCHWDPSAGTPEVEAPIATPRVAAETVKEAVDRLQDGRKTALLLGGAAISNDGLELAGRIAAKTGVQLLAETAPSRLARGAGRVHAQTVPYLLDLALQFFKESGIEQIILVSTLTPVATFAYQNMPVLKVPDGCEVWTYATVDHNVMTALTDLAGAVGAGDETVDRVQRVEPKPPSGELTVEAVGQSACLLMPEDTILVDEAITATGPLFAETTHARPHDYLIATNGGAIGAGLPVALGASIACPDRKVVLLQGDGSAMYTNQALWTMAREDCDVTVVLLKNDSYGVLNIELARVREGEPNDKMLSLLKIDRPSIDWVQLAQSVGVPATRADTAEAFHAQFTEAMAQKGPRLIEAEVVADMGPVTELIYKGSQELRAKK